jgi:hypothetical protein
MRAPEADFPAEAEIGIISGEILFRLMARCHRSVPEIEKRRRV